MNNSQHVLYGELRLGALGSSVTPAQLCGAVGSWLVPRCIDPLEDPMPRYNETRARSIQEVWIHTPNTAQRGPVKHVYKFLTCIRRTFQGSTSSGPISPRVRPTTSAKGANSTYLDRERWASTDSLPHDVTIDCRPHPHVACWQQQPAAVNKIMENVDQRVRVPQDIGMFQLSTVIRALESSAGLGFPP